MSPIYPSGLAGAGLLLLRLALVVSLLSLMQSLAPVADWRQVPVLLIAAALCIGIRARLVAALSLPAALYAAAGGAASPTLIFLHVANAAVLAMTGAGAFSADARLFGRRRVKVPGADDTSV